MTNRCAFEALDCTLRNLTRNDHLMGGICTLLCGDFRQILPVIPRGTRGNIVDACVKKSYLWDSIIVKHLHTNMKVHLCGDQAARQFADQLEMASSQLKLTLLMLSNYLRLWVHLCLTLKSLCLEYTMTCCLTLLTSHGYQSTVFWLLLTKPPVPSTQP